MVGLKTVHVDRTTPSPSDAQCGRGKQKGDEARSPAMEDEHPITARAIVLVAQGTRLVRKPDALRRVPLGGS